MFCIYINHYSIYRKIINYYEKCYGADSMSKDNKKDVKRYLGSTRTEWALAVFTISLNYLPKFALQCIYAARSGFAFDTFVVANFITTMIALVIFSIRFNGFYTWWCAPNMIGGFRPFERFGWKKAFYYLGKVFLNLGIQISDIITDILFIIQLHDESATMDTRDLYLVALIFFCVAIPFKIYEFRYKPLLMYEEADTNLSLKNTREDTELHGMAAHYYNKGDSAHLGKLSRIVCFSSCGNCFVDGIPKLVVQGLYTARFKTWTIFLILNLTFSILGIICGCLMNTVDFLIHAA